MIKGGVKGNRTKNTKRQTVQTQKFKTKKQIANTPKNNKSLNICSNNPLCARKQEYKKTDTALLTNENYDNLLTNEHSLDINTLFEVFNKSRNPYHVIKHYFKHTTKNKQEYKNFIDYLKLLHDFYMKDKDKFINLINYLSTEILQGKKDGPVKQYTTYYVMTLARQDLENIDCVYFYDFLFFNKELDSDIFAVEPAFQNHEGKLSHEYYKREDYDTEYLIYYDEIMKHMNNYNKDISNKTYLKTYISTLTWEKAFNKGATNKNMMKIMVASYLIFILKIISNKKLNKFTKELEENIQYLNKDNLSLEDCVKHYVCFYNLFFHEDIFPDILIGRTDVNDKSDKLSTSDNIIEHDVEKSKQLRNVVCYDENVTNKYRKYDIINSINKGTDDQPNIKINDPNSIYHVGTNIDNLKESLNPMKQIVQNKHTIMLHNVDNSFDLENVLYIHNKMMGLKLNDEPILLFQEVNSMNIKETFNNNDFQYKPCTVINGELFFTDKHMYKIYSGESVRFGNFQNKDMYTDYEQIVSNKDSFIKKHEKYRKIILNFYELCQRLYKNKKQVSIIEEFEEFSKFFNNLPLNENQLVSKFQKLYNIVQKVIKTHEEDTYKLKLFKRLLVHNFRNTAKSVTNIYYGYINDDNTKILHVLDDVYSFPVVQFEKLRIERSYTEKGDKKIRNDDVFTIKNAKIMIHELNRKTECSELVDFYGKSINKKRSNLSVSSLGIGSEIYKTFLGKFYKYEDDDEKAKRQKRGGNQEDKYYYIYCDERLNVSNNKKHEDVSDNSKKLLTLFPQSFYDPNNDNSDGKYICLGVVDVVGYNKNHVFLALRGNNRDTEDRCIVNIHLESGGQVKEHLYGVMELRKMFKIIMNKHNKWFQDIDNVIVMGDFNLSSNVVTEICYEEMKKLKKPDRYCKVMFDRLRTHTPKTVKVATQKENEINNYTTFNLKIQTIENKIISEYKKPKDISIKKLFDIDKKWFEDVNKLIKEQSLDEHLLNLLSTTFPKAFKKSHDNERMKKGCIDNAIVLSKSKIKQSIVAVGARRNYISDPKKYPYDDISKYVDCILSNTKDDLKARLREKLGIGKNVTKDDLKDLQNLNALFFSDHSPIILSKLEFEPKIKNVSDEIEITKQERFSIS